MNQPVNQENRLAFAAFISLLIVLALLFAAVLSARAAGSFGGQAITGRLEITWGDSPTGGTQTLYTLHTLDGQSIPLSFSDPLPLTIEELIALRGELVRIEVTSAVSGQIETGFEAWQVNALDAEAAQPEAVTGAQPWVSILCKFSDYTAEPKTPFYFQDMYRSTYPGMDHYWREQSFDLMNVVGSDATNLWYYLPQPRSYYVYDMGNDGDLDFDHSRATTDCTAVANAEIYFPSFVGINMMFNAELDGYAWGGSQYITLDGVTKLWYTTWEPPWGYDDITVIAHEMGHGFGLPHSSGEYGKTYDNQWDVMSDTWTNCVRSTDPTFGCLGQHTNAYHKDKEGWLGGRLLNVPLYSSATITLEQLAKPQTADYLAARVPINGSATLYYTVEARRNTSANGYDVKLPGSAVIIHEVDTTRGIPAHVKDIDGNGNTGDAGAQWLPGETFSDAANKITITVNSATATGFVVTICNACNEPTPTPPPPTPTPTPTPAPIPMHVGDLDGQAVPSGSKWTARVTILVHDQSNNPVSGATVTGAWSAGAKGSVSCTTNSSGLCTVSKANLSSRTASVTFSMTSVVRSSYSYQSSANHDPDGDSNGTVIIVRK